MAIGAAITVVSIAATIYAHSRLFLPVPRAVGNDERYIAPFALRMIMGHWLPYVDGVSHRGPVLYWFATIFQRIFGAYGWTGMRLLSATAVVATTALTFGAGAVARFPIGGAIGGALYAFIIICGFGVEDGMQINGEYVAAPIGMAALFAVAWAMMRARTQRSRYRLLVIGGLLAALQGLTKQTALPTVGPLALWALACEPLTATSKGRLKQLVAISAAWLGLLCLVVAVYAVAGSLWDFVYYFWRYNFEIYMEPYRSVSLFKEALGLWGGYQSIGLTLVVITLAGPLMVLARSNDLRSRGVSYAYGTVGLEATIALETALTAASAIMACRFWPHYWVLTIPFATLFIGVAFERALGAANSLGSVLAHLLGPAALITALWPQTGARLTVLKQNHSGAKPAENPMCTEIQKQSRPDDYIFIWGFDGDLHIDCHRRPASRFLFSTFVAGVVPPFWTESKPTRVALRSRQTLLRELTEKPVQLIVELPNGGVSMASIPMYATLLADKYCPPREVSGEGRTAKMYRLRASGPCDTGG